MSFLRPYLNISAEESVMKAVDAREEQKEKLAALTKQRNALQKKVDENQVKGEVYKKAVQARLNERAQKAMPALDDYDSISLGKIIYDQLGQHVGKLFEMLYNGASRDMQNYGYLSKQFFSTSLTADVLSRHLTKSISSSTSSSTTSSTSSSSMIPFDHLVVPLLEEMNDAKQNPLAVTPLLEFAHEGCLPPRELETSVLLLKENLSKYRNRVGGTYTSGKRVNWESILDLLKFTTTSRDASARQQSATTALSLVDQADACAERIDVSSREGNWEACLGNIEKLWTILAPTIRGYSSSSSSSSSLHVSSSKDNEEDDDDFSIQNTNVPLLKSMFDVRSAVEQRLAIESYLHYAEAMKTRQQFAFTWKLFEMEQQENPSLPPQHQQQQQQQRK